MLSLLPTRVSSKSKAAFTRRGSRYQLPIYRRVDEKFNNAKLNAFVEMRKLMGNGRRCYSRGEIFVALINDVNSRTKTKHVIFR